MIGHGWTVEERIEAARREIAAARRARSLVAAGGSPSDDEGPGMTMSELLGPSDGPYRG